MTLTSLNLAMDYRNQSLALHELNVRILNLGEGE